MKVIYSIVVSLLLISCKPQSTSERLENHFNQIKVNEDQLLDFMQKLPKGGDLHHHAIGAVYAESFIEKALVDSLFISPKTYGLYNSFQESLLTNDTAILLSNFLQSNPSNRDSIINYWSIRDYQKDSRNGHDWFFNTFFKFAPAFFGNEAALISELCSNAKRDNISYLETMIMDQKIVNQLRPITRNVQLEIMKYSLIEQKFPAISEQVYGEWYTRFENNGIDQLSLKHAKSLDSIISQIDTQGVHVKFLTYAVRVFPKNLNVFAELVLAFKTAELSNNVVGVNFLAPEDNINALEDYSNHMKMFRFLKSKHPNVNITLHSGEVVMGLGKTEANDLKFHINEAIQIGSASRIGHGVDILKEENYTAILDTMKIRRIAVEINLTSNAVILERNSKNHPINTYINAGVPICISTDDEGVLRTNLTEQYTLLTKYVPDMSYAQLKSIVYNSITYSFLSEKSKNTLKDDLDNRFRLFESEVLISK